MLPQEIDCPVSKQGNYLTKSFGLKVVFESAIVPTWKSGVITFNNVFVSRRPGQHDKKERAVSKGSSTTAAAEAAKTGSLRRRVAARNPTKELFVMPLDTRPFGIPNCCTLTPLVALETTPLASAGVTEGISDE